MAALRGEHIEGQGNTEARWNASCQLNALPTTTVEQLLGHARRVVVVSPHPDDEVLGCGGLLAMAIDSGREVLIVSVTDGEAAYPDEDAWPPTRLAAARREELRHALSCLGVDPEHVVRLDMGDGQVRAGVIALGARLVDLLKPSDAVLVTYARDGHPDHEACADAATRAVASCAARLIQFPVWAWHWDDPHASQVLASATRLALPPASHAAKMRAIYAFKTQTGHVTPALRNPILPDWALARFRRDFEVYLP
ncbi:PIG-L family deacetylase [Xanthomonas prunicola]|uniref:PIG-L family deacetylase n=1 Tax=Xanthomonas prunicola TaxID=2053930 RepID=A0A9Q9MRK7_9XANT|nr:PIG-L deacetylase family protein [Xanthomonas prunicola]USJ00475.1 PIG-L family deacetylase [Xanthomonas prunicola]UXA49029.1 PIG-L family deacetylase [Xanthomonas prunicola]UXA57331.1 PIG-L family deacetylase [Xanthomonas prunicola]UXA63285.1 PIG-L family deacetylase [Xanthomonas prunicola]UXA65503.1 PIG-L family deacetylase [Xanthomonas prunicola]